MKGEEILNEYKAEIDEHIEKLIIEYSLTDESEIEALTSRYKQNFIKGFHQGQKAEAIKIAQKLLASGLNIEEVVEFTELTKAEIEGAL